MHKLRQLPLCVSDDEVDVVAERHCRVNFDLELPCRIRQAKEKYLVDRGGGAQKKLTLDTTSGDEVALPWQDFSRHRHTDFLPIGVAETVCNSVAVPLFASKHREKYNEALR